MKDDKHEFFDVIQAMREGRKNISVRMLEEKVSEIADQVFSIGAEYPTGSGENPIGSIEEAKKIALRFIKSRKVTVETPEEKYKRVMFSLGLV